MEKKTYSFSIGTAATQEELNLEQDYKLMDLLSELGIGEGEEMLNTSVKEVIVKLAKNNIIAKLLDIILIVDPEAKPDWSKMKNSELQEVITDFFSLNPLLLQLFKGLGSGRGIQSLNTTLSGTEQNAQNTTPGF